MEWTASDRIRIRASLVIQVIDDYNNKVVKNGITLRIENVSKPIVKSEGYYIFKNLETKEVDVHIKSANYVDTTVTINLDDLEPSNPLVKIRVMPTWNYSISDGTTCLKGCVKPNTAIHLIFDEESRYLRLLNDCDKGDQLQIFNPKRLNLEGRDYLLLGKSDNEKITIKSLTGQDENLYSLVKTLEHSYKKTEAKLIPILQTISDDQGDYFLIIGPQNVEEVTCKCFVDEEEHEVVIKRGIVNQLNFKE